MNLLKYLVVFILFLNSTNLFSQTITLDDLKFLSSGIELSNAERLENKNYVLTNSWDNKYGSNLREFVFGDERSGDGFISVRMENYNDGRIVVTIFFSKKFDSNFNNLKTTINNSLPKLSYYYDKYYKLYYTEYKLNNSYINFTKGQGWNSVDNFKYGTIILTNRSRNN